MNIDWVSPKMEVRGPTRQPEGCLARPPSWPRHAPSWMPGGPPWCPLSPIRPPWGRNPGYRRISVFRRPMGRKPTEDKSHLRRADSAGEITLLELCPRGNNKLYYYNSRFIINVYMSML